MLAAQLAQAPKIVASNRDKIANNTMNEKKFDLKRVFSPQTRMDWRSFSKHSYIARVARRPITEWRAWGSTKEIVITAMATYWKNSAFFSNG